MLLASTPKKSGGVLSAAVVKVSSIETASLLAASGTHPKIAQSIMRHKDINLTMSLYTHTLRGQEADAISKLPDLSKPSEQGSGTDG